MKETRRLDVLAIIGGVLAVIAIIYPKVWQSHIGWDQKDLEANARRSILANADTPDMRADLEFLSPWSLGDGVKSRLPALRASVGKHPDSARLQFRLGRTTDGSESVKAMREAARLDKDNALPLYVLASNACKEGRWTEARRLVAEGNARRYLDPYSVPLSLCKGNGLLEMYMISANSSMSMGGFLPIRRVAVGLGKHALQLQEKGQTADAINLLSDVRRMGWKTIHDLRDANGMGVLVGVAIIKIADKHEKQILTETGDRAKLERLQTDRERLVLLQAGVRYQMDRGMDELVGRLVRYTASIAALTGALALIAILLVLSLIWRGVLAIRSRNQPGSALHAAATTLAFPVRTLMTAYGILLGVLALSTLALVVTASHGQESLPDIADYIGIAASAFAITALTIWASVAYKKGFRRAAEAATETVSHPWKGYPISDKRERQRRMTGFLGGAMVSLVPGLILLSVYTKTAMRIYPWQVERVPAGLYQQEQRFIRSLVAGKVKVPQKYIDEVKHEEMKRTGGVK